MRRPARQFELPGLGTFRRTVTAAGDGPDAARFVTWDGRFRPAEGPGVRVYVADADAADTPEARRRLAEGLGPWVTREAELRRAVAAELLDLTNNGRAARTPPEPPLALDDLAARLRLLEVNWEDGAASAEYAVDEPGFRPVPKVRVDRGADGALAVRPYLVSALAPSTERVLALMEAYTRGGLGLVPPAAPTRTGRTVAVPGLGALHEEVHRGAGDVRGGRGTGPVHVEWTAALALPGAPSVPAAVEDRWDDRLPPERVRALGERLAAFARGEAEARPAVAAATLETAADWWASGDEGAEAGPLTPEGYLALLRPTSVHVADGEPHAAYYEDEGGAVFAGHVIAATFDARGALEDATLAG